jgi:hypothetical protein
LFFPVCVNDVLDEIGSVGLIQCCLPVYFVSQSIDDFTINIALGPLACDALDNISGHLIDYSLPFCPKGTIFLFSRR